MSLNNSITVVIVVEFEADIVMMYETITMMKQQGLKKFSLLNNADYLATNQGQRISVAVLHLWGKG